MLVNREGLCTYSVWKTDSLPLLQKLMRASQQQKHFTLKSQWWNKNLIRLCLQWIALSNNVNRTNRSLSHGLLKLSCALQSLWEPVKHLVPWAFSLQSAAGPQLLQLMKHPSSLLLKAWAGPCSLRPPTSLWETWNLRAHSKLTKLECAF